MSPPLFQTSLAGNAGSPPGSVPIRIDRGLTAALESVRFLPGNRKIGRDILTKHESLDKGLYGCLLVGWHYTVVVIRIDIVAKPVSYAIRAVDFLRRH